MFHEEEPNHGFIRGALCGGLLGSAAGLLLAPKSGQQLRCDITDAYADLAQKTEDVTNQMKEKSHYFLPEEESESPTSTFVVGSLVGVALGVAAAIILAPKSGADFRKDIGKKCENVKDTAEDWKETLVDLVDSLNSNLSKKSKKNGRSRIDDVLDVASMGINVWQNLQKRR